MKRRCRGYEFHFERRHNAHIMMHFIEWNMNNGLLFVVRMQWNKQNYTYENREISFLRVRWQVRFGLSLWAFSVRFVWKWERSHVYFILFHPYCLLQPICLFWWSAACVRCAASMWFSWFSPDAVLCAMRCDAVICCLAATVAMVAEKTMMLLVVVMTLQKLCSRGRVNLS